MGVILAVIIYILLLLVVAARRMEEQDWNDGKCPDCLEPWNQFDMDSQGGRGYTCRSCDRTIWISYNVDKRSTK